VTREGAQSLVFAATPVELIVGRTKITLRATRRELEAEVTVRLFEYGAASVSFEVPIPEGAELASLVPWCDELYDSPQLDRLARESLDPVLAQLQTAVRGRHDWEEIETYTIVYVRRFERDVLAADVLGSPALASLVLGETPERRLSAGQRKDVLEHAHSYFEDDLVVVDWNSAFVLEPSGSRDVPDLLEFATSQLLELRYYDELFDKELARVHRELERARIRRLGDVVRDPWTALGRGVVRSLVELTELTERVDNALKVVGDFYLARVYESAVRRFRIRAWQASIDAKQELLARAHGLIRGELESRRSTILELIVIVLIVLEIVLAVVRH
jgi:hypothetical protein